MFDIIFHATGKSLTEHIVRSYSPHLAQSHHLDTASTLALCLLDNNPSTGTEVQGRIQMTVIYKVTWNMLVCFFRLK